MKGHTVRVGTRKEPAVCLKRSTRCKIGQKQEASSAEASPASSAKQEASSAKQEASSAKQEDSSAKQEDSLPEPSSRKELNRLHHQGRNSTGAGIIQEGTEPAESSRKQEDRMEAEPVVDEGLCDGVYGRTCLPGLVDCRRPIYILSIYICRYIFTDIYLSSTDIYFVTL
ncbi:hypothetical protein TNCV_1132671 [Trichonephila clavipes]|nr:hypothetical protein TNCV_1132671 [Trichonephila clavipes]